MILRVKGAPPARGKNHNARHPMVIHRRKKQWEELAAWAWKARQPKEPLDHSRHPHTITVALPLNRARQADPHNFTSFEVAWLVDGLVKVGAFEDDTAAYLHVADPKLFQVKRGDQLPIFVWVDEPAPERVTVARPGQGTVEYELL